jgi:hypothetical protein
VRQPESWAPGQAAWSDSVRQRPRVTQEYQVRQRVPLLETGQESRQMAAGVSGISPTIPSRPLQGMSSERHSTWAAWAAWDEGRRRQQRGGRTDDLTGERKQTRIMAGACRREKTQCQTLQKFLERALPCDLTEGNRDCRPVPSAACTPSPLGLHWPRPVPGSRPLFLRPLTPALSPRARSLFPLPLPGLVR